MSKTPNIYGGGSKTNKNGLHFEQVTSLNKALGDAGYIIKSNEVYYNKELIGVSVPKKQLYTKFLEKQGKITQDTILSNGNPMKHLLISKTKQLT